MASCGRDPHPRPRRPVARRGRGAGRVRHRARALAAGRDASLARCVDRRDRAKPGDRPDPPRADVRPQGRAARTSGGGAGGRGGRHELHSRRAAGAPLHVLPPGARRRGAHRAHAARGGRAADARDRPRLSRDRAGARATARPRQAAPTRNGDPVPGTARPPAARTPPRRAPRPLPRLQRGVCGYGGRRARPTRALRGGDPAREAPLRPDAGRARGVRAARAAPAPGLAT